jgi:hypothetical protein
MHKTNTKTATFSMLEKDILLVVMKEDAVVAFNEAKENYEMAVRLTSGGKYVVLVDGRAHATITDEGREFSTRPETYKNVIAQAIVIESLANRLLANFLIQLHKRNKNAEMKLFNDYDAALTWLKEKLEENKNGSKPKVSWKIPFLSSI